jgi:dUTP pyrophosphatase
MITFKKLHPRAVLPTRGSAESAGLDLTAISVELDTDSWASVYVARTGLAVRLPEGHYGQIAPRSGLARKFGVQVLGGVIDRDYTGELVAMLHAPCGLPQGAGYRVAQLLVLPCRTDEAGWMDGELEETGRGTNGFGSTGA